MAQLHVEINKDDPDINVIMSLIKDGVDIEYMDHGMTPLSRAACNCPVEIVELLIKAGADINSVNVIKPYNTPLHMAVFNPSSDVFDLLIEAGANINVTNFNGHTPLMLAVLSNRHNIVKSLNQ